MDYFIARDTALSFDAAIARVTEALAQQGFSILTDIDMRQALREKLGAEFRPYRILGSCNAALAQQALGIEPQIGALMPCNWMLQQHDDGRVEVSVMNPALIVGVTGNPALRQVQDEVERRVRAVIEQL
jgi:uncharacterized protein (DUF302 family)